MQEIGGMTGPADVLGISDQPEPSDRQRPGCRPAPEPARVGGGRCAALIDRLASGERLTAGEYTELIEGRTAPLMTYARGLATETRRRHYGDRVFIRGLIEFTNYCGNDCYYCGIRKSNAKAQRYRLTKEQILECCEAGYRLGFRTFVLQGGEDGYFTDARLEAVIRAIKTGYPDCALTLSVGERTRESYRRLKEAGADRYLLRHETADHAHYAKLHPARMTLSHRLQCLQDLKDLGFQAGCGFMVGPPGQTAACLGQDLYWIQQFRPAMVGLGPFIPHRDTPFGEEPAGDLELTLYLLALVRLTLPKVLLPATTALGTLAPDGREQGVMSGANVVMPNLSPLQVREKYMLYDNKAHTGDEAAECVEGLRRSMAAVGCELAVDRGDSQLWSDEQSS